MYSKNDRFYKVFDEVFSVSTNKINIDIFDTSDIYEKVLYDFVKINTAKDDSDHRRWVNSFFDDVANIRINKKHDEADYNFLLGWVAVRTGQTADIEPRFKTVERIDPANPYTYTYLSNFYRKTDADKNYLYAKKAYESLPDCNIMLNDYGSLLTMSDRWSNPKLGLELLKKAADLGNPFALYNIANYYAHIGDYLNNVRYHGMSWEKTRDQDSLQLFFNNLSDILLNDIDIKPKDQVEKITELIRIGANYDYRVAEFVYGRMLVKMSGITEGNPFDYSTFIDNDLLNTGITLILDSYRLGLNLARNYLLNKCWLDENEFYKYDLANPLYGCEHLRIRPERVFTSLNKSCFDLNW